MDLSVIVPLYNEKENVGELYRRIKTELQKLSLTYEIIFVDDGSTDGTTEAIKEIKKSEPELKLIIFNRNYGQTEAMAAGFEAARGEILVTMDGDLQNDPADIPRILNKMDQGYSVVCGWRRSRKDRLLSRRLPSLIANKLIAYVTQVKIHDLGCTLKGFRREIIQHLNLYSEMHRFIPVLAASVGLHVIEIPVTHRERRRGTSKYGLSRTWKVLLDIIKIKMLVDFSSKPTALFGLSSIPFWLLGFVFMGRYFWDFMQTKAVTQDAVVILGTGILFTFLAFTLATFGYLTELVVKTGDYRQNKILGEVL